MDKRHRKSGKFRHVVFDIQAIYNIIRQTDPLIAKLRNMSKQRLRFLRTSAGGCVEFSRLASAAEAAGVAAASSLSLEKSACLQIYSLRRQQTLYTQKGYVEIVVTKD